jgi:hypothetical protein
MNDAVSAKSTSRDRREAVRADRGERVREAHAYSRTL